MQETQHLRVYMLGAGKFSEISALVHLLVHLLTCTKVRVLVHLLHVHLLHVTGWRTFEKLLRVYMLGAGMVLAALALTYTTPWDNYLVYKGIWSYPQGRVLMSLGWVPVEEYSFFVIQTAFTCLWFLTVLERQVREARGGEGGEWGQTQHARGCRHARVMFVCSFCLSLITRGLTHARTYSYMQSLPARSLYCCILYNMKNCNNVQSTSYISATLSLARVRTHMHAHTHTHMLASHANTDTDAGS